MLRTVLVLSLLAIPASAQLELPRASPKASVSQTIGTTEITIEYHRPGVKQRTIWGGLVPWDRTWRMGANEATTITFSDPVRVEGSEVPAGTYSFFAIPGRDRWTLILNKDPEQFGAFGYDQGKDQLRVNVTPVASPQSEWMRFTIDPVTPATAVVNLEWEKLRVPMRVEVDVPQIVWADVDRAMISTWDQAAAWALESGERMDQGLVWIDQSLSRGENLFNLWTKARLLQKLGRSREAVPVMEKSLSLARGNVPQEFIDILEGSLRSMKSDAGQ
ncbi:MAG TPA: DUF2911 domain-containing protein [Thermoanaerobaculia bacterium]|nr:DUF2911 domain-containing protein [Thermoanaerobaculia bacterium]